MTRTRDIENPLTKCELRNEASKIALEIEQFNINADVRLNDGTFGFIDLDDLLELRADAVDILDQLDAFITEFRSASELRASKANSLRAGRARAVPAPIGGLPPKGTPQPPAMLA